MSAPDRERTVFWALAMILLGWLAAIIGIGVLLVIL